MSTGDQAMLRSEHVRLHGQDGVFPLVNKMLATGDGMYDGGDAYYLEVGANALKLIHQALSAAGRSVSDITRVLDYACGFGRVLRWLRAGFPLAHIVAADADARAIKAVQEIFNVDSVALDRSLTEKLGGDFDLIWMGSLATHLPETQLKPLIARLSSLLSARGVLVFTTHGPCVARRIATGEKLYNLDPEGAALIVAARLLSLVEEAGLQPIFYQERGWVKHQDCIAATRAP
jgi:SAM-dependent methyltransferase